MLFFLMKKNEKFMMIPVIILSNLFSRNRLFVIIGAMDDDDLTEGVNDWYDYCKKMFRKVTKNDLIEFENKYKGKRKDINSI